MVGESVTQQIARRLGFAEPDVALLGAMVAHHLLLPHTATRRDLDDPATITRVVDTLAATDGARKVDGGPGLLLDLLEALAEADSLATGPGVWSPWKQSLLAELGRRCRAALAGERIGRVPSEPVAPDVVAAVAAGGRLQVRFSGRHPATVLVVVADRPGVLSAAAGVLALHSLEVHAAELETAATEATARAGRSRCCGSRCRRASAACPTRPCCAPSWAVCSTARSRSARRWPARSATTRRCCRRGRSPPRPGCCGSTTR